MLLRPISSAIWRRTRTACGKSSSSFVAIIRSSPTMPCSRAVAIISPVGLMPAGFASVIRRCILPRSPASQRFQSFCGNMVRPLHVTLRTRHHWISRTKVSVFMRANDLTNPWSQPLAVPITSFHMTSAPRFAAKLALASDGSALSR
jgi:hypothetical protein